MISYLHYTDVSSIRRYAYVTCINGNFLSALICAKCILWPLDSLTVCEKYPAGNTITGVLLTAYFLPYVGLEMKKSCSHLSSMTSFMAVLHMTNTPTRFWL